VKTGRGSPLWGSGYVIAPVIARCSHSTLAGDFGRSETASTITTSLETATISSRARREPSPETLRAFLAAAPGRPALERLDDPQRPLKTLVVCGVDEDLLVFTQQHVLRARSHEITSGIRVLKQATGIEDVVILTLREAVRGCRHIGGRVLDVGPFTVSTPPVMHQVFGQGPGGTGPEDLGFCFMRAEAVAAIGAACRDRPVPSQVDPLARDETPVGETPSGLGSATLSRGTESRSPRETASCSAAPCAAEPPIPWTSRFSPTRTPS
jgi:hypothetical protein